MRYVGNQPWFLRGTVPKLYSGDIKDRPVAATPHPRPRPFRHTPPTTPTTFTVTGPEHATAPMDDGEDENVSTWPAFHHVRGQEVTPAPCPLRQTVQRLQGIVDRDLKRLNS